ncbi:DUF5343 domain-containing protein [Aeromicrobium endophyticum]|uniref:Uncharacterized protein n=1 Tax=Aeromicrobium endophyticum TaxID=2292704 RepID=A0A371P3Y1_9ACTN|nr:DUF5343 domain-containing protein [Aeromicrobium endophyticum]REK70220.1 hypothetical protein DX116_13755 [Aeromicrobium endophyticum]
MTAIPYVTDVRDVRRVLRLVERGTMPSAVTTKHLIANGIPEHDAAHVRGLLESLGFVGADGVPTPAYVGYRESDDRAEVLADAVRRAYGLLLDDEPSDEALARLVAEHGDVSADAAHQVLSTFAALRELADLQTPAAASIEAVTPQRRAVVGHISRLMQASIAEFDTARVCLQHDLTRPAVVWAWNSFAALAFAHLADDDFAVLRTSGRRAQLDPVELMRKVDGAELIELLVVGGQIGAADRAVLEQLLCRRDDCARPATPAPDRDEAAAYLSSVLAQSALLTQHPLAHQASEPVTAP